YLTEYMNTHSTTHATPTDNEHKYVSKIESLPRNSHFKFRKVHFQLHDLEMINQVAYWNYQRDRIFARSSRRLNSAAEKAKRPRRYQLHVNKTITCPSPVSCSKCCGKILYKHCH